MSQPTKHFHQNTTSWLLFLFPTKCKCHRNSMVQGWMCVIVMQCATLLPMLWYKVKFCKYEVKHHGTKQNSTAQSKMQWHKENAAAGSTMHWHKEKYQGMTKNVTDQSTIPWHEEQYHGISWHNKKCLSTMHNAATNTMAQHIMQPSVLPWHDYSIKQCCSGTKRNTKWQWQQCNDKPPLHRLIVFPKKNNVKQDFLSSIHYHCFPFMESLWCVGISKTSLGGDTLLPL